MIRIKVSKGRSYLSALETCQRARRHPVKMTSQFRTKFGVCNSCLSVQPRVRLHFNWICAQTISMTAIVLVFSGIFWPCKCS